MNIFERNQKSAENFASNWDNIWSQKNKKKLKFIRKKEELYFNVIGLLNKYLSTFNYKDKNYSIIELGCGGSASFNNLIKKYKNLKLFGLEKSLSGCKLALEYCEESSNLNIICGDVIKPPFKHSSFNIVFSIGLIEHFANPYEVLKKHYEILKSDGILICVIPNLIGLQGKFFNFLDRKNLEKNNNWIYGMRYITPNDLRRWLKELDCKKIIVKPIGGIHPFLMLESYSSKKRLREIKIEKILYQILFFLPLVILNIPFIFRLNSVTFSPFIVAICKK
jgi:SAM-dependent methyltransferase